MTKSRWLFLTTRVAALNVALVIPVAVVAQDGPASRLVKDYIAAENQRKEQDRLDALAAAQVKLMEAQAAALKTAGNSVDPTVKVFSAKHPEAHNKDIVTAMGCWSNIVAPAQGATGLAYLEALLILAKADPTCGSGN